MANRRQRQMCIRDRGNTEQSGGTSQGTGSNPSGDNKGDTGQDGDGDYELK